jgi:hypothetical protein
MTRYLALTVVGMLAAAASMGWAFSHSAGAQPGSGGCCVECPCPDCPCCNDGNCTEPCPDCPCCAQCCATDKGGAPNACTSACAPADTAAAERCCPGQE